MQTGEAAGHKMRLPYYNTRNHAIGFAQRTRTNLEFIEQAATEGKDVHVVTQIVNSMLGLVMFPWAEGVADHLKQQPIDQLAQQGWTQWTVTHGPSENLGHVLRHLRNGIAHRHLMFSSESLDPKQVTITVEDWHPTSGEMVWCGEIRADRLREFCLCFIDLVEQHYG